MGHISVNVDLAQVAFEVVDAVVGQLSLGAVLPDGQGLGSPVILFVQNGIQTAGQLAVQIALEDIAERIHGVALRGKFQIGRHIHQADLRAALAQLLSQ